MVKAILLKPLDGRAIGTTHDFSDADFARLVERNAVKAAAPTQNKAAPAPENKSVKPEGKEKVVSPAVVRRAPHKNGGRND